MGPADPAFRALQPVSESRGQLGYPLFPPRLRQRQAERSRIRYEHAQALRARDGGVEKVLREHDEMRRQEGDDDDRILAALALVDARRISEGQKGDVRVLVVDVS